MNKYLFEQFYQYFLFLKGKTMSYKKDGKCSKCGSKDRRYGEYTRAYNDLCKQAAGNAGYYCMNCTHIDFHTPDFETWFARMPRWIVRKKGDAWRDDAEQKMHPTSGGLTAADELIG